MAAKKKMSLMRKLSALTLLFFMALAISVVMTPIFLMSDWFDYCSDGKWSESVNDIWKS